jgi:tRNA(fMet)-specific endonuclease VapC
MEVSILLDTNRLTDALRADQAAVEVVEFAARVCIPFVTLAEIKAGFLRGTKAENNERLLTRFLGLPGVEVLFADHETTDVYARLFAQIRNAGAMMPTNDLWIASLAIQHHLALATRDRHFNNVPGLVTI